MKSRLTLGQVLKPHEQAIFSQALAREALILDRLIKLRMTSSSPRGRTYRIGKITSSAKKFKGQGFRSYKTKSGKTRYVVGAKFYRASAIGQPPAIRTGGLLNANKIKRIGFMRWRVYNSKRYAGILDSIGGLRRPFFAVTVKEFKPGYLARLRATLKSL